MVAISVLEGLGFMHERDWMHRDVKPNNLLMGRDGSFKLADFGETNILRDDVLETNKGAQMYISPERIMAMGQGVYGVEADVWSYGLTLLELGVLAYPFDVGEDMNIFALFNIVSDALPSQHTVPCIESVAL